MKKLLSIILIILLVVFFIRHLLALIPALIILTGISVGIYFVLKGKFIKRVEEKLKSKRYSK